LCKKFSPIRINSGKERQQTKKIKLQYQQTVIIPTE